jgi:L-fucose isomerase-like protein
MSVKEVVKKEVVPVLEDSKFKGVQHVSVDKTVAVVGKELESNDQVELVARQSEISRVGMIMKKVEEDFKAKILTMKTENRDEKDGEREFKVLYFRVVFAKAV